MWGRACASRYSLQISMMDASTPGDLCLCRQSLKRLALAAFAPTEADSESSHSCLVCPRMMFSSLGAVQPFLPNLNIHLADPKTLQTQACAPRDYRSATGETGPLQR